MSDDCPPGWTRNLTETGFRDIDGNLRRLCQKRLLRPDGTLLYVDEIVRVGTPPSAFWIDRHEASVVRAPALTNGAFESETEPTDLLRNGRWNLEQRTSDPSETLRAPYFARSIVGAAPARWVTWFQASELCRMSGKQLPTGDEWITAALGTDDPGENNGAVNAACNTLGVGPTATPRGTGGGGRCRSSWGAQDMVGNVWEWTAEWFAGVGNQTNFMPMMQAGARVNDQYDAWPAGYGTDGTWNVNAVIARAPGASEQSRVGMPSAAIRGGSWSDRSQAGVYSLYLNSGPSDWATSVGFRCVLRR